MDNQEPLTIVALISQLKERGMLFNDEKKAIAFFQHISYFRLKYYWKDKILPDKTFKLETTFEEILERYYFDTGLRLILFEAIQIIEVALRTKFINYLSISQGNGLWYLNSNLFEDEKYHERFVSELKQDFVRSTEPFAKHYIEEHPDFLSRNVKEDYPDAWMILETSTFGNLSKAYKNLKNQLPERSKIANDFGFCSAKEFSTSWEAIVVLRNVIAHHSRLYNRKFAKRPADMKHSFYAWIKSSLSLHQKHNLYGILISILYLCNAIEKRNSIREKIFLLLERYPSVDLHNLGFLQDWRKESIWK